MDCSIHVLETRRIETNGLIHGERHNDLYLVPTRTALPQSFFFYSTSNKQGCSGCKELPEIKVAENPEHASLQLYGVT